MNAARLACTLLLLPCALVADEWRRVTKSAIHMGVEFEAVVYARDSAAADRALEKALARVGELDALLSDYRPESEVSRLSEQSGAAESLTVGNDLIQVLLAARTISERSGGAFDVTAGALTKLWRRARRLKEYPTAENLREALATVGYRNLEFDADKKLARLSQAGARIDLGGIAKGYAAEEALKILVDSGFTMALVRASGDIAVHDPPPNESGWKIAVAPLNPDDPPTIFLRLVRQAVSTSGESRQHFIHAGKRYSHLVNPKTGIALTGRISVTVVSPRATIADSLASAAAILGPDSALKLMPTFAHTEAYLTTANDDGSNLRTFSTPGFKSLISPQTAP